MRYRLIMQNLIIVSLFAVIGALHGFLVFKFIPERWEAESNILSARLGDEIIESAPDLTNRLRSASTIQSVAALSGQSRFEAVNDIQRGLRTYPYGSGVKLSVSAGSCDMAVEASRSFLAVVSKQQNELADLRRSILLERRENAQRLYMANVKAFLEMTREFPELAMQFVPQFPETVLMNVPSITPTAFSIPPGCRAKPVSPSVVFLVLLGGGLGLAVGLAVLISKARPWDRGKVQGDRT